jgi:hypothetical protein
LVLAALAAALMAVPAGAQTSPGFNHNSTGFVLEGVHARLECDDCHKRSLPRSLPKDCNTCHLQGGVRATTAQSLNHIPTSPAQSCQDCHNQNSWSAAVMRHTTAMLGQCARCHDGVKAPGRSATHIPTTASCDACHTTGAWTPVKIMVHDATAVGRCSTCHNGSTATGKPSFHIPTTAQCDTCHTSTVTWLNAQFTHDPSTWGRCSTCHNGSTALGKPPAHIPTSSQCDTCHTSQVTFSVVAMNHTGLNGQCSTCHSGAYVSQNAQTKPATHVPTTAQCDTCHSSTVTWATATFTHPGGALICSSCHNSVNALGKPTPHVPTSLQCDTCHTNYVAFKPAFMNHTGTAAQCATCHNGTYTFANAQTRAAVHIPTSRSCDACHLNFVAFSPATMDHTGLNGQCSTCHNGGYISENAQMKPVTHTPTTAQCDTCHNSTTTWATAVFAHDSTAFGNCSNCHKPGGPGLNKPTNHVPTVQQCDTCHTNFAAFKPAFMNHIGTIGQCSTCHNGSYVFAKADKQGATHIPDTRQCDTCHTSTTGWTLISFVHPANAPGQCSNCHSGQYLTENAQTKPVTHTPTTAQCDSCHSSMTSWATALFNHNSLTPPATGRCSNCHTPGAVAPNLQGLTRPSTHIPTALQCDTCHTNFIAFKPALMNHTGTTGQCSTCHNGSYAATNAQPQGATHIPTPAQCDSCHTSTVAWTSRTMNHTVVSATPCATCHSGAYLSENAQQRSPSHIPVGAIVCSSCHTNFVAFSPATMNHTAVVATACATCHGGAYVAANAQTKPATHLVTALACNSSGCHSGYATWATGAGYAHNQPTDATSCGVTCHLPGTSGLSKPSPHVPTTLICSTCHKMPPAAAAFKPAFMTHTGAMTGQCSTCHNATYAFANANSQGSTHIPTGAQCDTCHTSTANWTSRTMNHAGLAGQCATCHTGGYVSENADMKGSSHIPTTLQCDSCHTSTVNWTTRTMNHTAVAATPCSTCHSGAYLSENAQSKGATHVPETRECNVCHTSTTVWTQRTYVHPTTATGNCQLCHGGAYVSENALAKPVNHIPYESQILAGSGLSCDACHLSTTSWITPEKMNHNNSQGNGSGFCKGCHASGTTYLGNMQKKSLTHNKSTGVTDCSQSGCHRPMGNTGTAYKSWS